MNTHRRWSMMFLGAAIFNFLIGGSILFVLFLRTGIGKGAK